MLQPRQVRCRRAGCEEENKDKNKIFHTQIMDSASLLASFREQAPRFQSYNRHMEAIYKVYLHNPPHYFVPNAMYMVTGSILHKQHLLSEDRRKEFFLQTLFERANLFFWNMEAWSALDNHYHFVAQAPEDAMTLAKLLQQVHSITAIQFNKWDKTPAGRSGKITGILASPTKNPIWRGFDTFMKTQ